MKSVRSLFREKAASLLLATSLATGLAASPAVLAHHAPSTNAAANQNIPADPGEYEFRHKRTVRITGGITPELAADVIQKLRWLDENNPNNEDITLIINSPGGQVDSGLAIYDAIMALKSDVRTVCEGDAASMAAFLLSTGAAGKRSSLPNCAIMIHEPLGNPGYDQTTNLKIYQAEMDRLKKLMVDIMAAHSGQDRDKLAKLLERDNYLTPQQAKDLGLIDKIDEPRRRPVPPQGRPAPSA